MADEDPEVIRLQMEQTRTALQEKLETLEKQVTDTVQGAAEAATETVQSVKEAVQETVDTVKCGVEDTVDSVRESLDINQHVRDHPWAMFVGAAALGFFATRLLQPGRASSAAAAVPAPAAAPSPVPDVSSAPTPMPRNGKHATSNGGKAARNAVSDAVGAGLLSQVAKHYGDELAKLQGLALGTVGAVVREMLTSSAPPALSEQIADIVDGITEKLGGKPVAGPVFQSSPCSGVKAGATDNDQQGRNPDPWAAAKARGGIGLG